MIKSCGVTEGGRNGTTDSSNFSDGDGDVAEEEKDEGIQVRALDDEQEEDDQMEEQEGDKEEKEEEKKEEEKKKEEEEYGQERKQEEELQSLKAGTRYFLCRAGKAQT